MNTFAQVILTLALSAGAAFGLSSTDLGADAGVGAAVDLFDDFAADVSAGADVSADDSPGAEANAGVDASVEGGDGLLGIDLSGLFGLGD